ncbi:MAG: F0F1 ATP synthase subunit delta [Rhodocyclaceae bacterium]|nr:MAG: F0F1 ATP synthase subunit delta [Rhodocyclaceae bacterium]
MAENVTLARPYAEATYQLALAGNALSEWSEMLERMVAVAAHPEMRVCIDNPRLPARDLTQMFVDAVDGSLTADQKSFVRLLVENRRLGVVTEIRKLYLELKNAHDGVRDAQITSAFPLDAASLTQLVADLEHRFKCKIQATVNVDPELIGGARIAVGDQVIDASVRGKLAAMSVALQN